MAELQDIFRQYGEEYRARHNLSVPQGKVMRAVEDCRTAKLGAHAEICEDCGNVRIAYNSCRNRHCPKCQSLAKEHWIDGRRHDLLQTGYFHVVFTVPDLLNQLIYHNQRQLYSLLFRCTAETLAELAEKPKYLGAQIGCTAVLHTWGQNLRFHPHIHCIVPGGGLDALGRWRSSRKKFFIPVRVMSRLFRGKFLHHLQTMKLDFYGEQKHLENPADFQRLLQSCYEKEWVVYCKPPFGSADHVVRYLGRYTHRVAISNHRILSVRDGKVTFEWKDYKENGKRKVMTLSAHEFIRRFLLHVLPHRFMKIRHFGILSNRDKSRRLKICKRLTGTPIRPRLSLSTPELILRLTGYDVTRCPACGSTNLRSCAFPQNSS